MYLRTNRRTTNLTSWKILNGHISAMDHPIHFMFGSREGFSRSADRMALHPLDQIQDRGRQPSCIILNGHVPERVHLIQFVFGSRVKVQETRSPAVVGMADHTALQQPIMQKLWCIHANRSSRFLVMLMTKKLASRHRAVYPN